MTVPFWCLFVVLIIPYLLAPVAGYFKTKQLGSYDNKAPRTQAAALEGAGARAVAAQANAWEAAAVFTAAVLVNHLKGGADPGTSALLAEGFVLCRVLHAIFYLANLDILRSLIFTAGMVAAVALFLA
jgi:uncharacterized MAPEG superfamily protein